MEETVILSDYGSAPLATEIYRILAQKPGLPGALRPFNPNDLYLNRFRDGEVDAQICTNMRDRMVFILKSPLGLESRWDPDAKDGFQKGHAYKLVGEQWEQRADLSLEYSPPRWIEELAVINDAAKRASSAKNVNMMFYMPYLRKDRKEKPRVPITAKLMAKLHEASGVDHVITLEPHFKQLGGFYEIPFDVLSSAILCADYFKSTFKSLEDFVVTSLDVGGVERAQGFAQLLGLPLVMSNKRRDPVTGETRAEILKGDLDLGGKKAITFEDLVDSGGSVVHHGKDLQELGITDLYACCAHPVLSGNAVSRLAEAKIHLVTTNSIPLKKSEYIEVLSLAHIGAEAIYQLCTSGSISESLFDLKKYQALKREHEALLQKTQGTSEKTALL